MAITNVARTAKSGGAPGDPSFKDVVTLDLDASYPATNGYEDMTTVLAGQIGPNRPIIGFTQNNFAGTPKVLVGYDRTNDSLRCYLATTGIEVTGTTDLSGVVGLELVVTSK